MSKDKIADYDGTTAGNNTDIGGISIAEGMLPSAVNNSMRELTKQLGAFADGTDAIDALTVTGDLTVDTNTLHVDAANNRVGVGTTSPAATQHTLSGNAVVSIQATTNSTSGYHEYRYNTSTVAGYIGNGSGLLSGANNSDFIVRSEADLVFNSNGNNERGRFLSGGGLTFNGDTAAANAISDYETGSWTATMGGSTTNPSSSITTTGYYQKIGRLVYLQAQFTNVNTSGAAGGFRITGLPYNPSTSTATGNVMLHKRFNASASNTVNICPYVVSGGNHIAFYLAIHNSAWVEVTHNPGNDHYCAFTVVYHTD